MNLRILNFLDLLLYFKPYLIIYSIDRIMNPNLISLIMVLQFLTIANSTSILLQQNNSIIKGLLYRNDSSTKFLNYLKILLLFINNRKTILKFQ
jgi:hypothetical protein